jgi:hypothetical protein
MNSLGAIGVGQTLECSGDAIAAQTPDLRRRKFLMFRTKSYSSIDFSELRSSVPDVSYDFICASLERIAVVLFSGSQSGDIPYSLSSNQLC